MLCLLVPLVPDFVAVCRVDRASTSMDERESYHARRRVERGRVGQAVCGRSAGAELSKGRPHWWPAFQGPAVFLQRAAAENYAAGALFAECLRRATLFIGA